MISLLLLLSSIQLQEGEAEKLLFSQCIMIKWTNIYNCNDVCSQDNLISIAKNYISQICLKVLSNLHNHTLYP